MLWLLILGIWQLYVLIFVEICNIYLSFCDWFIFLSIISSKAINDDILQSVLFCWDRILFLCTWLPYLFYCSIEFVWWLMMNRIFHILVAHSHAYRTACKNHLKYTVAKAQFSTKAYWKSWLNVNETIKLYFCSLNAPKIQLK